MKSQIDLFFLNKSEIHPTQPHFNPEKEESSLSAAGNSRWLYHNKNRKTILQSLFDNQTLKTVRNPIRTNEVGGYKINICRNICILQIYLQIQIADH